MAGFQVQNDGENGFRYGNAMDKAEKPMEDDRKGVAVDELV